MMDIVKWDRWPYMMACGHDYSDLREHSDLPGKMYCQKCRDETRRIFRILSENEKSRMLADHARAAMAGKGEG